MQKKARGFGAGKWNGPGGKVDSGETPEEAIVREIEEEADIGIRDLKLMAELDFVFDNPESDNYSYVYVTNKYAGTIKASDEGELRWFDVGGLPLDDMWPDDRYWLPQVLKGERVKMRFYFDKDNNLVKHNKI